MADRSTAVGRVHLGRMGGLLIVEGSWKDISLVLRTDGIASGALVPRSEEAPQVHNPALSNTRRTRQTTASA